MSLDKIQLQAERWLRTAEEDLEAGLPAQRCGTWPGGGPLPAESLSGVARAAQAGRVRERICTTSRRRGEVGGIGGEK